MKLPDQIVVTFTEEDRQTAQPYTSNTNCLLCTALKRMGFKDINVGGYGETDIGKNVYVTHGTFDCDLVENGSFIQPYYKESVVGMTLHLNRTH